MTSISGGGLKEFLYERLFRSLDLDRSEGLSLDELKTLGANGDDTGFAEAFKALDIDGDGKVIRTEMIAPPLLFTTGSLDALITAQANTPSAPVGTEINPSGRKFIVESPKSESEIQDIKALFSRADLDGDGLLSQDEMKAEDALQRAANRDAGHDARQIFISRDANQDGLIAADEMRSRIYHPLRLRVAFPDEASQEMQKLFIENRERHNALNPANPLPKPKIYSAEEKQRIRQQEDADWAKRMSGPEGSVMWLDREVPAYSDNARTEFDGLKMTDSPSARLMARILAGLEARAAKTSVIA